MDAGDADVEPILVTILDGERVVAFVEDEHLPFSAALCVRKASTRALKPRARTRGEDGRDPG